MHSEDFDKNNEFHQHLADLNYAYGRGELLAIVWSTSKVARVGMYVVQLQYGVAAFLFRVYPHSNGYTLKTCGRTQSRVSDYFDES